MIGSIRVQFGIVNNGQGRAPCKELSLRMSHMSKSVEDTKELAVCLSDD